MPDEPLFRMEGVAKRYGGVVANSDIDFTVNHGELRGIIGPNGAGKTTFFKMLTCEVPPTSGKIMFEGNDITGMAIADVCQLGLTKSYQINQLFLGKADELALGQYILVDRLGEGGMGQVYKARHRALSRVVALKVIRKECLDNPNALPRFQREIRAVAQLAHPNIIHAFVAGQVNGTYYYSMELVDGTDLSRLVK